MTVITATATGAGLEIDGLPLTPPRVSLLSSVDVTEQRSGLSDSEAIDPAARDMERALRWVNGIRFLPGPCVPPDDPVWWACPEGAGTAPSYTKTIPAPPSVVIYRPFDIWVGFRCSAMSIAQGPDFVAKADQAMEAFQSQIIEEELQLGFVARTAGFPNDYLENAPTILNGGADTGYVTALAELEQQLATCQPGQRGVIHAQPRTVVKWLQNGLVFPEPNGRRLVTSLGTIVVPGAGYDGGGPSFAAPVLATGGVASSYAYATGMVRVWLGPIRRLKGDPDETSNAIHASEIDQSVNTLHVRVERTVAAVWDECCQATIRVNHTSAH